ncbi:uncharacterized protein YjiS (DUF1127 family) [Tepidamorphus gemmatus]|uniref:Uncharacterized protein YjiS (DUF1127 family) n=1 Tax=Tepidamorphus gemmatus TaxID=747076 RepID=A0A4R3MJ97_9HYPH|nr:DUF1127 domain-containing protein [Tepidamorphus gemmatus]TCT11815.1 uncharacterized protein YjiS (DUF1127 family) [Tepidamorphus gemmatus]
MLNFLFTPVPFTVDARPTMSGRLILQTVSAVAGGLRRWHRRRVTIHRLQALDDVLLKDIGLSRGQIEGHIRRTDPERGHRFPIRDRAHIL